MVDNGVDQILNELTDNPRVHALVQEKGDLAFVGVVVHLAKQVRLHDPGMVRVYTDAVRKQGFGVVAVVRRSLHGVDQILNEDIAQA